MTRYVALRLLWIVPVVLGVSLIVFSIMKMVPGDVAQVIAGMDGTQEDVELIRRSLGLDRPVYEQYLIFLGNSLQGDFGRSAVTKRPVVDEIGSRIWPTAELAIAALAIALAVGLATGIVSATRQYSALDHTVTVGSFLGLALPNFWLALLLQIWLSVQLGWLPTISTGQADAPWDERWRYFVMPVLVLCLPNIAYFARFMRSAMLEVVHQDYVTVARAKGLGPRPVLYRHALRNALIPMVTVVGLQLPRILSGAVIIEQIFAWPGLGLLAYDAIGRRDYPGILGVTMLVGAAVMVVNLLVDVVYALVDPRISVTG